MFDCQPWKSYKKAINERKSLKKESDFVPGEIHLKPHCFKEYLKALGFRLVLTIDQTEDGQKLDKVIYAYMKN